MNKILKNTGLIVISSFVLFSCASNRVAKDKAALAYNKSDYKAAISYIKAENKEGDLIDLNLDEAMLLSMNGNYKESADLFNLTNHQMSLLSGEMTVGQIITAGLISEESIKYSGPAYEYALLDSMNAFNYLKLNDLDSARAMMRRSFNNNKQAFNELKEINRELNRQSELAFNSSSTQSAIREMEDAGLSYDFNKLKNNITNPNLYDYNLSPFNFYLGAVLFANDNDIYTAGDWLENIEHFISSDLRDSIINIPDGKGSINVVSLADTIVRRDEAVEFVPMLIDPFGLMINFKLAWPYVPKSFNIVKKVNVKIYKQKTESKKYSMVASAPAELIEDFDNAVRIDVNSKAEGAFSRSLIRNITRKTAAYIGGIIAIETANDLSEEVNSFVGTLALLNSVAALQITMNAIDENEHADIRQCIFFPSKARCAGIILDPGTYTVVVEYINESGHIENRDVIENVNVEEGIPTVVPSEFINTGNLIVTK